MNKWMRWLFFAVALGILIWGITADFARAQDPVPLEDPCPAAGDCRVFHQTVIWALTGNERSLAWIQDQGNVDGMDLFYRIEGHDFPPESPSVPFMTGETPEGTNVHLWTPVRAGFYFYQVRACRTDILQDGSVQDAELRPGTTDEWILCSVWAASYDPTYTDPVKYPRGFTMIVQLAPATGGTIE